MEMKRTIGFEGLLMGTLSLLLLSCDTQLNNPYGKSDSHQSVLYESFSERPKHLDPVSAYSSNEYAIIGQIYEPPLQYHYLKRPYELIPLTAVAMPTVTYLNAQGEPLTLPAQETDVAFTDYLIDIKPNIFYQPHPAFAKDSAGNYRYHALAPEQIATKNMLADFPQTGTRELIADDYVYQIKRLAHPKLQSPIAEMMKNYIVGFDEFTNLIRTKPLNALKNTPLSGLTISNRYQYHIRIKGKYPQLLYWLAMPFFAPMPWEADAFYDQTGMREKNMTLDWFPIGTGAYYLAENNPNRRMTLLKNPNFHNETYPSEGETGDAEKDLLQDAGKPLPFIDKVVFMLEKETIPYWTKFLQGYYDLSGISSDSFDQAVQFTGSGGIALTPSMQAKGIQLQTAVTLSNYYLGFNMLDPIVGGLRESARKLRQAIAIAVDYDEYISIFMNGRGISAQGVLPPGIFGYRDDENGINNHVYDWHEGKLQRKPIEVAQALLAEAGYANGIDPKTNEPLILYLDTTSISTDDRSRMNWYRKQFEKLGIKLIVRATDYNRFQEKIRIGNAQLFFLGWNADYPDPENFFFLLYGANGKVKYGGENASNYSNAEFDYLFEQMRNMENGTQRHQLIQKMQTIVQYDAPWVMGFHPKSFALYHQWFRNLKPNLMANNQLKYARLDVAMRQRQREQWNQPIWWPVILGISLLASAIVISAFKRRYNKD
jgi:ABC-type transport system substrate-binding protein